MPVAERYCDISHTFGVASRKKYLEDVKMRIEEAENRGESTRLSNDWIQHQKKSIDQGQLDDINKQLDRPMMPVRTTEELLEKPAGIKKT